MTYNNLQELFLKQEKLEYEKLQYEKELIKSKKLYKNSFKKRNKQYWKSVIDNYTEVINTYENQIKNIDTMFFQTLSFPKEIIMPFILECINLYENEKYELRSLILSLSNYQSKYSTLPSFGNYEIIFPESIKEEETKLEKSFYISILMPLYRDLFKKTKVKYIIVQTEGYINLLSNNFKLLACFEDFPYLEDISISLIERRLKEPDKKIFDILNDELSELKENKNSKNLCK